MPSRDERVSSRSGCKPRSVRNSFARQRLNCRTAALATTALVAVTAFASGVAKAQDATWRSDPATHNFNAAMNWNPATIPTGTAFFGVSSKPTLEFSTNTTVGGWTFNAGAPAYTFNNNQVLTFNGAGIVINGGSVAITDTSTGFVNFTGSSTAANSSITNHGNLNFNLNSTAGNAIITNNFATNFNAISTAGAATITNNVGGTLRFSDTASADGALITNHSSVFFQGNSTAGSASIINADDVSFNADSKAGSATITNAGTLNFNNGSSAGNAAITNALFGKMNFNSDSTAGNAIISNNANVFFKGASSAGDATIINQHNLFFSGASNASNANITNGTLGSQIVFGDNSTGGNAAITNASSGAVVDFSGSAGPAGNHELTAGSIAGGGVFQLGANELTVGGNNMSTDVSGLIVGIGSLFKVGAGTLTLSGGAALSGTTIDGGTLAVNGGTLDAFNTIVGSTAGSSGRLDVGAGGSASAVNLIVGQSGVGTLAVQTGGTVTDFGGFVGDLPGSQGTATVSGAGSTWTNTGTIQVGALGTGTLTIENGGALNSGGGGSIGLAAGSVGAVTVTGAGSTWNNSPGGGLNIGSSGTGALTIADGGTVINNTAFAANIGNRAGSLGTVMVTGAASSWSNSSGLNIGNLGTGTLTIADSGAVIAGPVVIATNGGAVGTLNIGAGAGSPASAPGTLTAPSVAFGAGIGTINFNHTSVDYVFAPAISGDGTVNVFAGSTTFTGANTYSGATNVEAGTLRAGALNTFSPNSAVTVASGGTLDLNGFNQTLPGVANAGLVNMGTFTAPGTVLTTTSYTGTGGSMAINTFLGGDGSPSDRLIISGGAATGATTVHVTNAGGPGAETTGDGIQVVSAINGATTAPGAFALPAGELRAGAFDYDLFRGGVSGSPNDWFLRSDFIIPPIPPEPPIPPIPPIPPDPPPNPLPPGVYPIIGPELATYGVVQPLARQLGLAILGTLDDRAGDTYQPDCSVAAPAPETTGVDLPTHKSLRTKKAAAAPCPLFWPSVWGRFFGQTLDNHYQAFADPRASGDMGGFQGGIDLLHGSLIAGQSERAGLYGAYGDVSADVTGLVTNPAATAYILTHTGSLNLDAWSAGGYWNRCRARRLVSRRRAARDLVRRLGQHSICQAGHQRHGLHRLLGERLSIRFAGTGAGLRARAARADLVAEGFVQARV